MFDINNQCNCGRLIKYSHFIEGKMVGSCNKYDVCKSYDDLSEELREIKKDLILLLQATGDILAFREGTDYYKDAESIVKEIADKYS